jgi:pimeloyl-[acyl-carrier protein] methyl ester esterase
MKPTVLIVSGWAHGLEAIKPIGDKLTDRFDIQLRTGAQVLEARSIPETDYIVTGSMGGLLAMELLPESCKKLVLISSTARFCADGDYTCGTHEKILRRMILQLKRNPAAVLEEFYKNVHYPHPAMQTDPGCSQDELVAGLNYLLESDVRDKAPKIEIPVLLLHGADDRIIPHSAAEWLNDHLPDSQLRIFENDGHALPAHHFNEVMDEISTFL